MAELFSKQDLMQAAAELATIPFFPAEAQLVVMQQLARMCPHKQALRFVVDTAVARCKRWPGISELRGLLCSRYNAADGIDEPSCSIRGFTPEECEERFYERELEALPTRQQILAPESAAMIQKLLLAAKPKGKVQ